MSGMATPEGGGRLEPEVLGLGCAHCKWWGAFADGTDRGFCRQRSPRCPTYHATLWPRTYSHEVCGDHEPRP